MQRVTCRVPAPASGAQALRLDQAIAQSDEGRRLGLSRTLVRKLLVAGAVYVNGRRVRVASRPMRGGEMIDLYYDKDRSPDLRPAVEQFLPLRVLYDDEAIICFDKPANLPTQPTLMKPGPISMSWPRRSSPRRPADSPCIWACTTGSIATRPEWCSSRSTRR